MRNRILGNTGLHVSEIGIGCEGLIDQTPKQNRMFLDMMLLSGVNFIDMYASTPQAFHNLSYALEGRRDKFILQAHIGAIFRDNKYQPTRRIDEVLEGFHEQIRTVSDYFEIGMIHGVSSVEDWKEIEEGPMLLYAEGLKDAGIIGHIGVFCHDVDSALAAVSAGRVEVLMLPVNPYMDIRFDEDGAAHIDPKRRELYDTCKREGVAIIAMRVAEDAKECETEGSPELTLNHRISWALKRPGVSAVMGKVKNLADLGGYLSYEDATEEERDYTEVLGEVGRD